MEGERIVVELEATLYILQNDGDYKVSYSVLGLHRRGCIQEDCLSILAQDVYSQHELEYLNDCVRPSEWVGWTTTFICTTRTGRPSAPTCSA